MPETYNNMIAKELDINTEQVKRTVNLFEDGCTVPFIARYRKEMTGSLDETKIIAIRDRISELKELDKRKKTIIRSLRTRDLLSKELQDNIEKATSLPRLEDIYLPYRPKRKTKASVAIDQGLEKLADEIIRENGRNIRGKAYDFISPEVGIDTVEDALQGACFIIAARINENTNVRKMIRRLFVEKGKIYSKVIAEDRDTEKKYRDYYDFSSKCNICPSHRVLALFRGEKEKILSVKLQPPENEAITRIENIILKGTESDPVLIKSAIIDSYKRLLAPSMETELRKAMKKKADIRSIKVFSDNLFQLLMAPPLGRKRILAIDPGFRTGCKVVCLDSDGKLIHHETIFPHPPHNMKERSSETISRLVDKFSIEAVSIGNGTAGRETEKFIRSLDLSQVIVTSVNENGASVYSASEAAREEFPNEDITVRGAVSIGRRLMDPLSELVKIDPKSIGVGQYQHDVDQKMLRQSLEDVVIHCVNRVGVDLNTASSYLLSYVSGIGKSVAGNIYIYRTENGPFRSRNDLLKVPGLGPSVFRQCAGFLRLPGASDPLDTTAVHPENYDTVKRMAKDSGCSIKDLIEDSSLRNSIDIKKYVDKQTGLPTLTDIINELAKPGRDPRNEFSVFEFREDIQSIDDLKEGMIIPGIVTNVTDFGAFVDIGIHHDGLIHISRMGNKFVKHPSTILGIGQRLNIKVIDIDVSRNRISLALEERQKKEAENYDS